MIISRALPLIRRAATQKTTTQLTNQIFSRNSGQWAYRESLKNEPYVDKLATGLGAFMWWWILWHVFTDYGHLIGEFPYPEPEKWTDEELGIPPDDQVYVQQ